MSRIKLAYVNAYRDRHGKRRHYFRRPGFKSVALPGLPGSAEFMAAYQAALSGQTAPPRQVGAERTKAGTLAALIVAHYQSTEFLALAQATRNNRRNILERLREGHGDKTVANIQGPHIRALMDAKAATPEAANNLRKALRALMGYAVERGWRTDDPTLGVRRVKHRTAGFTPWSRDDIGAFEGRWPAGSRERRALYLLLCVGQRRSDVVTMGRQHVADGKIAVTQVKTGKRLWIEIHPALQAELDRLPAGNLTFLTTQYGAPFSPAGFTNWFVDAAKAAGLTGRTPHGLRKSTLTLLADAGASAHEIQAVSGHANLQEVQTYTADADQKRLATSAIGKLRVGGPRDGEGGA